MLKLLALFKPDPGHTLTHIEKDASFWLVSADQGRIFRKVTESVGALAAIVMGMQFILHGYHPYIHVYRPMEVTADAVWWGMAMLGLGLIRLLVLIVNGWWSSSHMARKWLSFLFIFLVWLPLAACFWWNFLLDVWSDDPKTYPGLAYSMFTLGIEFMIFYAHSTYVYAVKESIRDG